jgi:hypothetical protein
MSVDSDLDTVVVVEVELWKPRNQQLLKRGETFEVSGFRKS